MLFWRLFVALVANCEKAWGHAAIKWVCWHNTYKWLKCMELVFFISDNKFIIKGFNTWVKNNCRVATEFLKGTFTKSTSEETFTKVTSEGTLTKGSSEGTST